MEPTLEASSKVVCPAHAWILCLPQQLYEGELPIIIRRLACHLERFMGQSSGGT